MDLIEELMIASNETMAQTLRQAGRSCIRRIVQVPARWDRIVELVARHGTQLPPAPDAAPLNAFLQAQRAADPDRYPDLALSVIKLMGPGQYVLAKGVPGPNDPLQGTLRPRRPGLRPLHRPQPPLRRPRHPAHRQSLPCRGSATLHR